MVVSNLAKMKQLDLRNTVFYEPTGLDQCNISTATDLVENSGRERLTCVVLGVPGETTSVSEKLVASSNGVLDRSGRLKKGAKG